MTYEQFKEQIQDFLQKQLEDTATISIQDIPKNNNTHYDGLHILSKNSNISPTISLNDYYKQYCTGRVFSEICQEILTIYEKNHPIQHIDVSFFTDYKKVKSRIIFKLIHYKQNRVLLTQIPHIRMLDLAIVFCCLVQTNDTEFATILIHHHHLTFWNINVSHLYKLAMQNTPLLLSYELTNLAELLCEFMTDFPALSNSDFITDIPMYILTNHQKLHGAGCILYPNLLNDLCETFHDDLYILPSSVHEVLLLPASNVHSSQNLCEIIKDVNRTQVQAEEILSDHAYFFSKKTRQLSIPLL